MGKHLVGFSTLALLAHAEAASGIELFAEWTLTDLGITFGALPNNQSFAFPYCHEIWKTKEARQRAFAGCANSFHPHKIEFFATVGAFRLHVFLVPSHCIPFDWWSFLKRQFTTAPGWKDILSRVADMTVHIVYPYQPPLDRSYAAPWTIGQALGRALRRRGHQVAQYSWDRPGAIQGTAVGAGGRSGGLCREGVPVQRGAVPGGRKP